jgi:hypothetical protein
VKSLRICQRKFSAACGTFPKSVQIKMTCVAQCALFGECDLDAHLFELDSIDLQPMFDLIGVFAVMFVCMFDDAVVKIMMVD